jgi:hypothetical protein
MRLNVPGWLSLLFVVAVADAAPPPNAVDAAAPAWVMEIAPGTWAEISRNTLADVDPAADPAVNPNHPGSAPWRGMVGQRGVLDAWNGGAFASRLGRYGALIAFGGGHNDYFGNEIYAFDLESRMWRRLTDPYAGSREAMVAYRADGAFPDGTPLPPHTYDTVDYHPRTNSLVLLRVAQQLGSGGQVLKGMPAYLYSFDSRQWRRSLALDHPLKAAGWSAYDSRRDGYWVNPPPSTPNRPGFRFFDPNGENADGSVGIWSESHGPRKPGGGDGMGSYEPQNDLVVYTDFRKEPGVVYAVEARRPASAAVPLGLRGDPPDLGYAHGWEWSDLRRGFVYWPRTAGADVHELRLGGDDWRRDPWTWRRLTSPSNRIVPQPMQFDRGVYSRFRLVRFRDAEVALVVNRADGPVYAFRVPAPVEEGAARLAHAGRRLPVLH